MKRLATLLAFNLLALLSIETYASAALPPPPELCKPHLKYFETYAASATHKAFAVSKDGSYGWSFGRDTIDDAKKAALTSCQRNTDETCRIYAVDNDLVNPKTNNPIKK
jgi:hypothetical protein